MFLRFFEYYSKNLHHCRGRNELDFPKAICCQVFSYGLSRSHILNTAFPKLYFNNVCKMYINKSHVLSSTGTLEILSNLKRETQKAIKLGISLLNILRKENC